MIDDAVPEGGMKASQDLQKALANVIRAQANGHARSRLDQELRFIASRDSRCSVAVTSEDQVQGSSAQARTIQVQVPVGTTDLALLTLAQAAGRAGRFAQVMASYIVWLAARKEALGSWSQGDFVLLEVPFTSLHKPSESAIPDVAPLLEEGTEDFLDVSRIFPGAVLLSQTCDVVRTCVEENRACLQFAALVPATEALLEQVKDCQRPNYALVPGAMQHHLVANLNLVTLVEKPLCATWPRNRGCQNDQESRAFSMALARHKSRHAFPDDFSDHVVKALQDRMVNRHGSKAPLDQGNADQRSAALEAHGARALREIRVTARPSWSEPTEVLFYMIRKSKSDGISEAQWEELRTIWQGLLATHGSFTKKPEVKIVLLSEMDAEEYVGSDQLDLDYLSSSKK